MSEVTAPADKVLAQILNILGLTDQHVNLVRHIQILVCIEVFSIFIVGLFLKLIQPLKNPK